MNIVKSETINITLTEGEIKEAILNLLRSKETTENAEYFKNLSLSNITFRSNGNIILNPVSAEIEKHNSVNPTSDLVPTKTDVMDSNNQS